MIPIIFPPTATDFTTNGAGRLSDCISCTAHSTFDGEDELTLTYPMTGRHYDVIEQDAVILAQPSATRSPQPYRIYKISRPINGQVQIWARHLTYQLSLITTGAFSATSLSAALDLMMSLSLPSNRFVLEADFDTEASYAVTVPATVRSLMGGSPGSIQGVYGGAWEWDGYHAILHRDPSRETGIRIAYGKNLRDLTAEEDNGELYTSVYPYWESGSTLIVLPERTVDCENVDAFPFPRVQPLDCSTVFDAQPTAEQLREYAQSYMESQGFGIPKVSLDLSFYNLGDLEEYRGLFSEDLGLFDIVTVSFPALGVERQSQISEITWDVLRERYDGIVVGDRRDTLATTIEEQMETIQTMPTTADVKKSIDHATGILAAGRGGHVVLNRNSDGWVDEILIMDNADYSAARRVLRINQNGIGFSSSGYAGPYLQAWLMDGTLTLGGVNNGYGVLRLLNSSGEVIGTFSATDGLAFVRGQNIGFKADGTSVYIGDFYVADEYGRQILQSTDLKTGMSGEPDQAGQLYLWAGWESDSQCTFLVNNQGEVRIQGTLYYNGETLDDLIDGVYERGYNDGEREGYSAGYADGYADGQAAGPTPTP
jgi:phage minor structural protein